MFTIGHRTNQMTSIISKMVGLGFFLKQFYFFNAGTLQIGDIVLLASAGLYVMTYGMKFYKIDAPFYLFILSVCLINGIYSIINGVLFSDTFYWIFNLLLISLLFRPMLEEDEFLDTLQVAFRMAMLFQLVMIITGKGYWMAEERYVGTFTDPNQFGFYILCSFFIQYIIDVVNNRRFNFLWGMIAVFEIIFSGSAGMTIGLIMFAAIAFLIGNDWKSFTVNRFLLIIGFSAFLLIILVFSKEIFRLLRQTGIYLFQKSEERLNIEGGIFKGFIEDRGIDRVFAWPEYLLFGSGEGLLERFPMTSSVFDIEIHSSFFSLVFCYGIIPCFILGIWIVRNLRGMRKSLWCVYIGLFFESLSLVNYRQSMFWLLFLMASCEKAKSNSIPPLPTARLFSICSCQKNMFMLGREGRIKHPDEAVSNFTLNI